MPPESEERMNDAQKAQREMFPHQFPDPPTEQEAALRAEYEASDFVGPEPPTEQEEAQLMERERPLGGDCGYCGKPVDEPNPDCVGTYHPCPTCMGDHDKPAPLCTDPWHREAIVDIDLGSGRKVLTDMETQIAASEARVRELEEAMTPFQRLTLESVVKERDTALAALRELTEAVERHAERCADAQDEVEGEIGVVAAKARALLEKK